MGVGVEKRAGKEWKGAWKGIIECHDSSIWTSTFRGRERGVRVNLVLNSRAAASSPSTCARTYNASRASSSAVRFAKERRAAVNCPRNIYISTTEQSEEIFAHPRLHVHQRWLRRLC